jgi:hypothetical protein
LSSAAAVVQRQLEAYNARDLERFVACYAEHVRVYRPPAAEPVLAGRAALREHYAANRFNLPGLHAELVARLVMGNKVIDQERIVGIGDAPKDAAAVYEIGGDGLIAAVWFFDAS